MRWTIERQSQLRHSVENMAPADQVAEEADETGREVFAAWSYNADNLRDGIDELGTSVDIMDEQLAYRDCGIKTRVARVLLLTWDDRTAEAEDTLEVPFSIILDKLDGADPKNRSSLYPDAALLLGAKARIEQYKDNMPKALIFFKASWNAAQMTSKPDLKALILGQYHAALLHQGEFDVAAAALHFLMELREEALRDADWSVNPKLWNIEEHAHD